MRRLWKFNMSISEDSLVQFVENSGWEIYEDHADEPCWNLSASHISTGIVSCIVEDNRFKALLSLRDQVEKLNSSLRSEFGLTINFKRLHPDAVVPTYSKVGDAGMDVTAVGVRVTADFIEYDLGFAVEIPLGYVGLLFPRSSISKMDLSLCNSVGVIDSGYRGPMVARFVMTNNVNTPQKLYAVGDRVAQLMFVPHPQTTFKEVNELSDSERGKSGFGSTGA